MFIFLFWLDDTIFSNLNTNPSKIQIEKNIKHKKFIATHIIDSDFEEL